MPYTLTFLRNDFRRHVRIIQISIQQRECVKQLHISNSTVPLHNLLKSISICVYIYFAYTLGIYTMADRDDFDDFSTPRFDGAIPLQ